MSSTTRLLVLGVVKLFQPVHGYVVRRELLSWRAQDWASVQPGSIYNALKTLTRDGLLEIASTDQVGGRPERTTYRLTSGGDEEFHTLLREAWWNVRVMFDPLMSAVSFLGQIPRAEAIAALEHRAAQIQGMVRHTEFAIAAIDPDESPDHVREMMRLLNARLSSELAWSEQFIARLRGREYRTADEPRWFPRSSQAAEAASEPPARRRAAPRGRGPARGAAPVPGAATDDAPGPPRSRRRRGSAEPRPARARRSGPARWSSSDPRAPQRADSGRAPRGSSASRDGGERRDRPGLDGFTRRDPRAGNAGSTTAARTARRTDRRPDRRPAAWPRGARPRRAR